MSEDGIIIVSYLVITACLFVFVLWAESKDDGKIKTDRDLLCVMVVTWPVWIWMLFAGLLAEWISKGVAKLITKIAKWRKGVT